MSKAKDKFNAIADLIESKATALNDGWKVNRTMLFLSDLGGISVLEKAMGNPIRYIEVLLQNPQEPATLHASGSVVDLSLVASVDIYFEYEPDVIFTDSSYEKFIDAMMTESTGILQSLYETSFTGGFTIGNPQDATLNELRLVDSNSGRLAHFTTFTIEVY